MALLDDINNGVDNGEDNGEETEVVDPTDNLQPTAGDSGVATTETIAPPPMTESETGINWDQYPRTMSEKVDALNTGDPAGLGHWELGTGRHGEPVVMTEDDQGRMQFLTVTEEKWMSIATAQEETNNKIKQYEAAKKELDTAIQDNQGAFDYGLNNLDDGTNPMLVAALKDAYQEDPIETLKMMYDLQRLEDRDAEAAAETKRQIGNNAAFRRSSGVASETQQTWNRHYTTQLEFYQRQIDTDPNADNTVHSNAQRTIRSHMDLASRASEYTPYAGMDMTLSPGQGQNNPYEAVEMYKTWLKLLQWGVPQEGKSPVVMSIIDPQGEGAWEDNVDNIVHHLQWLSSQFGWQGFVDPLTGNPMDLQSIKQAFKEHTGNQLLQTGVGNVQTVETRPAVADDPATPNVDESVPPEDVTVSDSRVSPYADQGGVSIETEMHTQDKASAESEAAMSGWERDLQNRIDAAELTDTKVSTEEKLANIGKILQETDDANKFAVIKVLLDTVKDLKVGETELKNQIMNILSAELRGLKPAAPATPAPATSP